MKNKQETERSVEATLNSLDGIQQVEANEFLYAKIMNRMSAGQRQEQPTYNRLMLRLSLALGVFVCLNVASFFFVMHKQDAPQQKRVSAKDAFTSEYSLNNDSYSY